MKRESKRSKRERQLERVRDFSQLCIRLGRDTDIQFRKVKACYLSLLNEVYGPSVDADEF